MVVKKIKTVWMNKVGIHEKYLEQARELNSGILLNYIGGQEQYVDNQMYIPLEQLEKGEIGQENYTERQGNGSYKLVYFKWKNNRHQPKLI